MTVIKDKYLAICKLLWLRTGGYLMDDCQDKRKWLLVKGGISRITIDGYETKQYEQEKRRLS